MDDAVSNKSPTLVFAVVNKIMNESMCKCFPKSKTLFDDETKQHKYQKKELMRHKKQIMLNTLKEQCGDNSVLSKTFSKWHNVVQVDKCSKKIKARTQSIESMKLALHEEEIQRAVLRNNSAEAWNQCRTISRAVKGSRMVFKNAPRTNPSTHAFLEKYTLPAIEGGWGGATHSFEEIAHMEPDLQCVF